MPYSGFCLALINANKDLSYLNAMHEGQHRTTLLDSYRLIPHPTNQSMPEHTHVQMPGKLSDDIRSRLCGLCAERGRRQGRERAATAWLRAVWQGPQPLACSAVKGPKHHFRMGGHLFLYSLYRQMYLRNVW